jgi:heat shock protein HslJ
MSDTRTPRFVPRAGVAAVVLALLVAACGGEPDLVGTGNAVPVPLVGTEWQLLETSVSGSTTAVPAEVDAVVRFDGEGGWSAHGCNYIGGGVEIHGMGLYFDDTSSSTSMGCADPAGSIDTAVTTVLQGDVDAAIDGEELTLTGPGGDWLRLEVRDGVFPSRTLTPLDEAPAARVTTASAMRAARAGRTPPGSSGRRPAARGDSPAPGRPPTRTGPTRSAARPRSR